MTSDIDFTAGFPPAHNIDIIIKDKLNYIFPDVTARLGYTGTRTEVFEVKKKPKEYADRIEKTASPSLEMTIQHVSKYDDRMKVEISFNEPSITSIDIFDIGDDIEIHAYSLIDVIAEKYRALLQQPIRRRARRQDVYDIHFLLEKFNFDEKKQVNILTSLRTKCHARHIEPNIHSIDDLKVVENAQKQWNTIELEIGKGNLPDFEYCFQTVRTFYYELPWDDL